MVRYFLDFFLKITKLRVVRYLVVGGFAAIVDLSIFSYLNIYFGFDIFWASITSFIFAVIANYYMGILLAFDSKVRFKRHEEFMLVCLVSASGLIFNIGTTYLLFYFGGINAIIAKTVAAIPTFLWNYILRRNFIFKKRN